MIPIKIYKYCFFLIFKIYCIALIFFNASIAQSKDKDEITISADKIEVSNDGNQINASGNIRVQSNEILSTSDKFSYNKANKMIDAKGNIIVKDNLDNYYYFDRFISNNKFDNANGLRVKMRLNDGSRIVGDTFTRTDSSINQINNATYTPCMQDNYVLKNCPGWKLNAEKVIHDTERKNIYYEGAILSILNVPVFYSPFFSHPDPSVKKRSGLLMPSFSSDNNLGTTISIPYFYNISSNYDLTFTPTIQTDADNFYSVNYRHLSKNNRLDIVSSISDDKSDTGTKNHFFLNGSVKNPYGKFNYAVQTSNNDTYLRKNHINDQTIFKSGLNFTKETNDSYLEFASYVYKHLNNSQGQKWEYVYPDINYNINSYSDPVFKYNWTINNSLLNYRDIDKNYNQQVSSEILSKKIYISRKTGFKFENITQNRLIYFNNSINDFNQLRVFPQLSSKISYPLSRNLGDRTEILEPIIMPILAPYNNYNNDHSISNNNIFSLNRETSLSQWENGPRINYGLNWLINNNNGLTISTSLGQSARINKKNTPEQPNEVSNYFIGNTLDFGNKGYIKTDITIDREDLYLKDNNINSSVTLGKVKFGFDYDYETSSRIKTSEQISIGTKINVFSDTELIMSLRKDLMSDKSIGNAFGLHYENDCLSINFDYFRDFTAVDDIKNSRGYSFTITLKPFGTSKQRGKVRNFGPNI